MLLHSSACMCVEAAPRPRSKERPSVRPLLIHGTRCCCCCCNVCNSDSSSSSTHLASASVYTCAPSVRSGDFVVVVSRFSPSAERREPAGGRRGKKERKKVFVKNLFGCWPRRRSKAETIKGEQDREEALLPLNQKVSLRRRRNQPGGDFELTCGLRTPPFAIRAATTQRPKRHPLPLLSLCR